MSTKISATVVADSVNVQGDRLTSVLVTMPRIIIAEMNTHRMLSKNTSSSRAIPFNKMVEAIQNDPFIPIAWQKDHKGMQGNEYIIDELAIKAKNHQWITASKVAIKQAEELNYDDGHKGGVTKQLRNRLLEPFMWTTMLITGNREGWDNFFNLRCPQYSIETLINGDIRLFKSKKDLLKELDYEPINPSSDLDFLKINKGQAEIHMMALAESIWDAVNESTPKQLKAREWHIPFGDIIDDIKIEELSWKQKWEYNDINANLYKVKISTAMAAHTSYTVVGNEPVKSYEKWIELHDKLIAYDPPHSSPMEHCARAMSELEYKAFYRGSRESFASIPEKEKQVKKNYGWCYNLKGFIPYRYMIDNKLNL